MEEINIDGRKIGKAHPPFLIAEMSGNHNQSLDRALKIVEAASKSGANAVKIQTYTPDTMTLNETKKEFMIQDSNSHWNNKSLYNLYKEAYTPWEWHEAIFSRCKELGMVAFSSPFDETAVDFLESLDVPCYKIASFENNDIPLIKKIVSTGKPIIMSTGMATVAELYESVNIAKEAGCNELVLLKCTSTYPATPANTNIKTIPHMEELFDVQVGLSDHTLGNGVAVASVALGATVIEKHFTLSREEGGVDSSFSMEPSEMELLAIELKQSWQALGKVVYGPTKNEKSSLRFRRSIYVSKDIDEGDYFTKENLRVIRPGYGLPPKYYEQMIGKQVRKDLKAGTPLTWDSF
ncbi:pseudaminic acid synthase [Aquibacillus koreensis]|uniref:Pseudaminic acid synthase n=1 Tax=Aquibacillus koreensis TaxID=279446 RepID=A0A9X3WJS4_9BACI|nr:pseudaminic acid synthase [Aquibacillus koreensis]MCT2536287.1 pseudaminic acid synthase [Aquibacillus koreensis]MDC3421362.1 pseudaminic acid synthase [Aquibacillus koreensis]